MCDPELFQGQGVHWAWKFSLLTHGSGASGNDCMDCQTYGFAFLFCWPCVCLYIHTVCRAVAEPFGHVGICFMLLVQMCVRVHMCVYMRKKERY